MDRSAKALESFCGDDETWVDSWTVSRIGSGLSGAMPGVTGTETVGLTDRRLLWLDENLESVALGDVESISVDALEHGNAPGSVRVGAAALVFGAIGSVAALFALSLPLATALAPLAVGLLLFVGSVAVARARAETGAEVVQHRLRIETPESVVTVWGDEADVEALAAAVDPSSDR